MTTRDMIRMTDTELWEFLAAPRKLHLATLNRDGTPHLVAMYYDVFDGRLGFWSYGKSQKIVNLRRDPRVSCLVETGDRYDTLRGVSITGRAVMVEDYETVRGVGARVYGRYLDGGVTDDLQHLIDQQANKRVAVFVEPERIVSWDHRKH